MGVVVRTENSARAQMAERGLPGLRGLAVPTSRRSHD